MVSSHTLISRRCSSPSDNTAMHSGSAAAFIGLNAFMQSDFSDRPVKSCIKAHPTGNTTKFPKSVKFP